MTDSCRLLLGDAAEQLATLPDGLCRCCITSPPYWGLRDYGMAGQIGLEGTPDAYVERLVAVFAEVRRVLADDGTLWLNLGDSYAASTLSNHGRGKATPALNGHGLPQVTNGAINPPRVAPTGDLKPKDLVGVPWLVAFALRADGWYLRSDIIWHKPNAMPESCRDRPTSAHEHLFLLSKSARYHYDAAAIAEPASGLTDHDLTGPGYAAPGQTPQGGNRERTGAGSGLRCDHVPRGRKGNARTFRGGGAYVHGRSFDNDGDGARESHGNSPNPTGTRNRRNVWTVATRPCSSAHFATFPEKLVEPCLLAGTEAGDWVLDPFAGTATTGAVALRLGRRFIGVELNQVYLDLAREHLRPQLDQGTLFDPAEVAGYA